MTSRSIVNAIRNGKATLRVLASGNGYRLAGEAGRTITEFGIIHSKRSVAIQHGEIEFNQTAKLKVVKKAA